MGLLASLRNVLELTRARPPREPRPGSSTTHKVTITRRASTRTDYESAYLPEDRHAELLNERPDGLPPLRLVQRNRELWLAEETTGLLINVDNRRLRRLGIFGVKVRGTRYYDGKARLGPAELVREPGNPHDPNAVAIFVGGQKIGYYNKGMASGLAKRLDSGDTLVARVISTNPAKVIATRPEVLKHLYRDV